MTRQRSSIDILEEAVNLLRSSPLETAVTYLIGAVPLTLGFLFFLEVSEAIRWRPFVQPSPEI